MAAVFAMQRTSMLESQERQQPREELTTKEQIIVVFCVLGLCICVVVVSGFITYLFHDTPIRNDIKGSWKLVDHMNFEGYQKANNHSSFETFSENLRYDVLVDGRLVQTGGGSPQLIEEAGKSGSCRNQFKSQPKNFEFYEEDNHMKSYRTDRSTEDRYMEDGKLIRVDFFEGGVTKRVYERI